MEKYSLWLWKKWKKPGKLWECFFSYFMVTLLQPLTYILNKSWCCGLCVCEISHWATRLPVARCLNTEYISLAEAAVEMRYFQQLIHHQWKSRTFPAMWNIFSRWMPEHRPATTIAFTCSLSTFQNQPTVCFSGSFHAYLQCSGYLFI